MTRGRSGYPITKSPEVGKWVTVNVNGNAHHEARILISPYTMRQFENLLSHLTDKLKPPFGAVWRLFTESGLEIKDLDDIKGGQTYIASGRARPVFAVRMGTKSGRGRRDRAAAAGGHGQRSHSAVGSLGGGADGDGGCSRSAREGTRVADAVSDTNVKHKHTLAYSAGGGPARPGPRRGLGKSRVGDGPTPTHHQLPVPTTKRKQSGHRTGAHYVECFEGDEAGRSHYQNHFKV